MGRSATAAGCFPADVSRVGCAGRRLLSVWPSPFYEGGRHLTSVSCQGRDCSCNNHKISKQTTELSSLCDSWGSF